MNDPDFPKYGHRIRQFTVIVVVVFFLALLIPLIIELID